MTDPPTRSEVRLAAIIVALCALILTSALAYGIVHKVNQGDEIVRTAASEANQVDRLSQQLDDQAQTISGLKSEIHLLLTRQDAQNRYLHKHKIVIPPAVFETQPRQGAVTRPKVPPAHRPPRHHHRPPASPGTTGGTPSPRPSLLAFLCALLGMKSCPTL